MAQMRSRREQVDAHKFITSRMNQALVLANPDSVERPLRRVGVSIFVSVMIMVLVFGGFAIAALLGKGNEEPTVGNIIVEKGTGSVYVYTYESEEAEKNGEDPKLWPVENYTSALLLLNWDGQGDPPVQELKPASLAGVARGFPVGIIGAPNSPPDPASLMQDQNWNVCSMPIEAGSNADHQLTQMVVKDLPTPSWLGEEQWMLAQNADNTEQLFLLWNDMKFEIPAEFESEVLSALDLQAGSALPINENMLNAIETGSPLVPRVEDFGYFGDPSGVQDGNVALNYGQPVESDGEYYVLMQDDDGQDQFAPIGDADRRLLELLPLSGVEIDDTAIEVGSSTINGTGAQASYRDSAAFPQDVHEAWTSSGDQPAVCGVFTPGTAKEEATVAVGMYNAAPSDLTEAAGSVTLSEDGNIEGNVEGQTAQTVVQAGRAVLVHAQSSPGQDIETFGYLIDDRGYRFGLVDQGKTGSTKALLGYASIPSVGVPQEFLDLIPKGADLDPEEAKKQLNPESEIPEYDVGDEESPSDGESASGGESPSDTGGE